MAGYTFVTVAHDVDLLLLKLQARSFAAHMNPDLVERIILVQNPGPFSWWREDLRPEYDALWDRVEILTAAHFGNVPPAHGWWIQQVLKLIVAKVVEDDRYMVLDAKNHWAFAPARRFFETDRGVPRLRRHGYRNHPLRPKLETTLKYFGLDPEAHLDNFPMTTPPFMFWRNHVWAMMQDVEIRSGREFPLGFVENRLTEFFAYFGYLLSRDYKIEQWYSFDQPPSPCIWPHQGGAPGCLDAIGQCETLGTPMFGVHRGAIHKMDDTARMILAQFWVRRGLFSSIDAGVKFLLAQAARAS